jgi:short-subunit dehydrogenase
MAMQGAGRIVNVTSAAARMALPNYAAYAATKAAVDSLTRSGASRSLRTASGSTASRPG